MVCRLRINVDENEEYSISRNDLYELFRKCNAHATIDSATFGKIVRLAHPRITTRRLGKRGNSKYHYQGIRVRDIPIPIPQDLPPAPAALQSALLGSGHINHHRQPQRRSSAQLIQQLEAPSSTDPFSSSSSNLALSQQTQLSPPVPFIPQSSSRQSFSSVNNFASLPPGVASRLVPVNPFAPNQPRSLQSEPPLKKRKDDGSSEPFLSFPSFIILSELLQLMIFFSPSAIAFLAAYEKYAESSMISLIGLNLTEVPFFLSFPFFLFFPLCDFPPPLRLRSWKL